MRKVIIRGLSGSTGLTSCDDVISFEEELAKFRSGTLSDAPTDFQQYFERALVKILRDNVAAGRNTWTNNNAETINSVIKNYVSWKPSQLQELINTLKEIIVAQHIDANRALCGRGEFMLKPAYVAHRLTVDVWRDMMAKQRQKAIDKCFRIMPAATSTSTTTDFTVPTTPGAGKKPRQCRRRLAERTTPTSVTKLVNGRRRTGVTQLVTQVR